jgi:hypothetical protein
MPLIPDIKIRGIRTPIPSGYVLGRTAGGTGDVHLIPIDQVGGVSSAGSFGSANSVGATAISASITATAANNAAQQALSMANYAAASSDDSAAIVDNWPTVPPPRPAVWGPFLVATLPKALTGDLAYVTDGDALLIWGATVINSGAGATTYLCWFNGVSWTVIGT